MAYKGDGLAKAFSEVFGMEISWEKTPAIFWLITHMREDAGTLATCLAKEEYFRPRPFIHFKQHTPLPDQEKELMNNGSFPSGHSAIGWAVALILSEINPARQTEIMKRGYDYGQSRVILRFHYQSDVDAGRIVGSVVVATLHANEEFAKDLAKAKAEFASLKN